MIAVAHKKNIDSKSVRRLSLFDISVFLYLLGALIGLLPLMNGVDWSTGIKRLGLVLVSVVLYFCVTRIIKKANLLKRLLIFLSISTTVIAVLGTAVLRISSARVTGLSYEVYSFAHKLLPFQGLPDIHPNVLGSFLVVFLSIPVALLFWGTGWILRLLGFICAAPIILAILASNSRSALLGIAALIFSTLLLLLGSHTRLVVTYLISFIFVLLGSRIYLLSSGFTFDDKTGVGRIELWQSTMVLIGDYPFTGIGLGQYESRIVPYATPLNWVENQPHAHNLFLQLWAEFGILGLLSIILLLFVTVRLFIRYYNLKLIDPSLRYICAGGLIGLTVFFVSGITEYGAWGGKLAPAFLIIPAVLSCCNLEMPKIHFGSFLHKYRKLALITAFISAFVITLPLLLINIASIMRPGFFSEQLYSMSSVLAPWNSAPERDLGLLKKEQQDESSAFIHLENAITREPKDWISLMTLGELSEKKGDHSSAIDYWRRAQAVPYLIKLSNVARQNNPKDLLRWKEYLEIAYAIDPQNSSVILQLVDYYITSGNKGKALELINSGLANATDSKLLLKAAELSSTTQEQISYLERAATLSPKDLGIYWQLGNTYWRNKQLDKAEEAFRKAMNINPSSQIPLRSIADLFHQQGRNQEVVTLLENFLQKQYYLENPYYEYYLLARSYFELNQFEKALSTVQVSIEQKSDFAKSYILKGSITKATGNKLVAIEAYMAALKIEPNNAQVRQEIEALQK